MKRLQRSLEKVKKEDTESSDEILVVSTHGKDKPLMNIMKKVQKDSKNIQFRYVKKTAASLGSMLVKSKRASLGNPYGATTKCGHGNCQCCDVVSNKDFVIGPNEKIIKTAKGICSNRCVIYHSRCAFCQKAYVGKATQRLNRRVNGHRSKFYECLYYDGDRQDIDDDDHLLGMHLYFQHGVREDIGFNESYKFTILENCSPRDIDLKEHLWIHRLKTLKPHGLNSHDPFGIPMIL